MILFPYNTVEEITQRTGNTKKFDVFVKMLLSALAQESDSVYLDVLTARDLEMLRSSAVFVLYFSSLVCKVLAKLRHAHAGRLAALPPAACAAACA